MGELERKSAIGKGQRIAGDKGHDEGREREGGELDGGEGEIDSGRGPYVFGRREGMWLSESQLGRRDCPNHLLQPSQDTPLSGPGFLSRLVL